MKMILMCRYNAGENEAYHETEETTQREDVILNLSFYPSEFAIATSSEQIYSCAYGQVPMILYPTDGSEIPVTEEFRYRLLNVILIYLFIEVPFIPL